MITISLYGLTSILCFGLPVLVIFLFRLHRHTSLVALALYYILTIFHCLSADTIPPVPDFTNRFDVLCTYIEMPLIMASLLFFCASRQRQVLMQRILMGFMVYEIAVALYFRFSAAATPFVVAPGLMVVIGYTSYLLVKQIQFALAHGKNIGRVLMLAAILFSYGTYAGVFYLYFLQGSREITQVYSIYFLASTIAAMMMAVGLYMMRHRIRELQELKIVRQELRMVFGPPTPQGGIS